MGITKHNTVAYLLSILLLFPGHLVCAAEYSEPDWTGNGLESLWHSAFRSLGFEVQWNGKAYRLIDSPLSWNEINQRLSQSGMGLACINSEEEDLFLRNYLRHTGRDQAYIGLYKDDSTGDWSWTSGEPFIYNGFESDDFSDRALGKYVVLQADEYGGGAWNCFSGTERAAYLCEWPVNNGSVSQTSAEEPRVQEYQRIKLTDDYWADLDKEIAGCDELLDELEIFAENENLADLDDEEHLERVRSFLERDERVLQYEVGNDNIVYLTQDRIPCIYRLPAEEGVLGSGVPDNVSYNDSIDSARAYTAWLNAGNTAKSDSELYLDGLNSITNKKYLVLSPASKDTGDETETYEEMAGIYEDKLGYQKECLRDNEAVQKILSGDLTDYGIVTMACHGAARMRPDETYTSMFFADYQGGHTQFLQDFRAVIEAQGNDNTDLPAPDYYWKGLFSEEDMDYLHLLEGRDLSETYIFFSEGGSLVVTSNYIMERYKDRYFDNTLIFFASCYSAQDDRFNDFLLTHGAKAYIGFRHLCYGPIAEAFYEQLFQSLLETDEGRSLKQFSQTDDLGDRVINEGKGIVYLHDAYVAFTVILNWKLAEDKGLSDLPEEVYNGIIKRKENPLIFGNPVTPIVFTSGSDISLLHYGIFSGNVKAKWTDHQIDENGNDRKEDVTDVPGEPVDITFDRYLNRNFGEGEHVKIRTDIEGEFLEDEMPWGIYGVQISGDTVESETGGITFSSEEFEDVITVKARHAQVTQPVMIQDDPEDPESLRLVSGAAVTYELLSADDQEQDNYAVGQTYSGETGADGVYRIGNLPGGSYRLCITAEGAKPYESAVSLANGTRWFHEDPVILEPAEPSGDYYDYIHTYMEPEFGYVEPRSGGTMLDLGGLAGTLSDIASGMTDAQKLSEGILSADVFDFNTDGLDDCVVCYVSQAEEPPTYEVRARVLSTDRTGVIYEACDECVSEILSGYCNYIAGGVERKNGIPCFYIEKYLAEYTSQVSDQGGISFTSWEFTAEEELRVHSSFSPDQIQDLDDPNDLYSAIGSMMDMPSFQGAYSDMLGDYTDILGINSDMSGSQSFVCFTAGNDYVITMEDDSGLREVMEARY